ncbi:MAG TPA: asparagine synthase (glutamine-hydrolyzing) [Verrucomicrobiae bacterium]|nr:asparagine synthase (glutamine-hydrolyzing) [Verrucomicrobiae bacterium]
MCGIAGICLPRPGSAPEIRTTLERMVVALRHRGPDDQGWQLMATHDPASGAVGMANARLAIQDLSPAGHQPMTDPETGNWIVFNGEIYNHPELRREIGDRAGRWRSTSDTETVLRAYRLWRYNCVEHFRGMFALAIWDAANGTLWCARDRLGIKPFYYSTQSGALLFASEVRALLASGWVRMELDPEGLAGYVRFGAVPEPFTLVAQVRSLPAGHWMRVRGAKIEEMRAYWTPQLARVHEPSAVAAQTIRAELERAVQEHLLSDVPVACFLSGGIDSSVVTGLAARQMDNRLQTFTLGFDGEKFDESSYAQSVATKFSTSHHLVRLSHEEVAAQVPDAVNAMDLPSMDGLNTYIISKAVAGHGYKVVLSGLGGDELFGGYPSFARAAWAERWSKWLGNVPAGVRALVAGGGNKGHRAAELTDKANSLRSRYSCLRALWSKSELQQMGISDPPELTSDAATADEDGLLASRVSVMELTGYMRSVLLRDCDVLSMAHGLELRVPLLDHRLVETCLASGAAQANGARLPKHWLLKAAGDLLPPAVADRPKQGFNLPMARWMQQPLRGFVKAGLTVVTDSGAVPRLDAARLEKDFTCGRLHWSRVWQFVALGHWLTNTRSGESMNRTTRETQGSRKA